MSHPHFELSAPAALPQGGLRVGDADAERNFHTYIYANFHPNRFGNAFADVHADIDSDSHADPHSHRFSDSESDLHFDSIEHSDAYAHRDLVVGPRRRSSSSLNGNFVLLP